MRSEREMLDLILTVAADDERIRAVYMNGSRTNPNVKKDDYRDFDVVYIVDDKRPFVENSKWIGIFGDIAIVQEPCLNDRFLYPDEEKDYYNWLILFTDGNRIDLTLIERADAVKNFLSDSLCEKLLDKDGLLPDIPASNDSLYRIKRPEEFEFNASCNEFWWCLNNVAKGLVRGQLPYAHRMFHQIVHIELERMTEWYIGAKNGSSVTSGMWGKYFVKYLPQSTYEQFLRTYSACDSDGIWDAVFEACEYFRIIAKQVAAMCDYVYNERDDRGICNYLKSMYAIYTRDKTDSESMN